MAERLQLGYLRSEEPARLSWRPASAPVVALAIVGTLLVLGVLGLGYASVAFGDRVSAIATAPAFGAATVSLAAVALDAIGLRLYDLWVAVAASALAGLGGLAVRLAERRLRREPPA